MNFANIKPSEFVDQLTVSGIALPAVGVVPLTKYLSSAPEFGGNKDAEDILGPLQRMKGKDGSSLISKTRNYGRLMSGQGYPDDFKIVMAFIAENLAEVKRLTVHDWEKKVDDKKKITFSARATYSAAKKYFADGDNPKTVLQNMVAGRVFGLDCIGFISQYLVAAGIWSEYKTYYPGDYVREFKPIKSLREISRLSLLIWGNYHIAIVDKIHDYIPGYDAPKPFAWMFARALEL